LNRLLLIASPRRIERRVADESGIISKSTGEMQPPTACFGRAIDPYRPSDDPRRDKVEHHSYG
jgi:hypothetical protein